jgi:hypothetical protein
MGQVDDHGDNYDEWARKDRLQNNKLHHIDELLIDAEDLDDSY